MPRTTRIARNPEQGRRETDGQYLLRARKLLGLTQEQMAEKLLCTQSNISWTESERQGLAPLSKREVKRLLVDAEMRGWPNAEDPEE